MMRLSTSFDNCILGFLDAETIDSLLDSVVVDLLSGGGGDEHISTISSFLSLGSFIGLTHGMDGN